MHRLLMLLLLLLLPAAGCREDADSIIPTPVAEEFFRRTFPIEDGVYDFTQRPAGPLFATASFGLARSNDSGRTWEPFSLAGPFPGPIASDTSGNIAILTTKGLDVLDAAGLFVETRVTDFSTVPIDSHTIHFPPSCMAVTPGGIILIGSSYSSGIIRSTDRGLTWSRTTMKRFPISAVHSTATGTVFAAVGINDTSIYRSTDLGLTWRPDTAVFGAVIEDFASDGKGTVYACGYPDIWRSTNNGASWQRTVTTRQLTTSVAVSAAGHLFITEFDRGTKRSTNGGVTWTSLPGTATRQQDRSLFIDKAGFLHVGTKALGAFRSMATTSP